MLKDVHGVQEVRVSSLIVVCLKGLKVNLLFLNGNGKAITFCL